MAAAAAALLPFVLTTIVSASSIAGALYPRSHHPHPPHHPVREIDARALPGSWTQVGCYSDTVAQRTLSSATYASGTAMTNEACVAFCDSKGFVRAGTEYSVECYCGNTLLNTATVLPMSSCNMKCSGNQAETCGGPNALLVFYSGVAPQAPPAGPTVLQAYDIWHSLGCYTDTVAARTLLTGVPVQGGPVTPQRCMDACKSAATPFKYAGVEYAGQCFCGDVLSNGGAPADASGCNMACAGDATLLCGGPNRLNLYTTIPSGPVVVPSYDGWVSLGCWTDSVPQRTLTTGAGIPGTVQGCLDACKNGGFHLGGVEYGGECWCGSQTAATGAPAASGCDMPCTGNGATLCGGSNRLNMYNHTTTTTTPPTTTTQPPANPTGPVELLTYAGWVSQGCWTDTVAQRTLTTGLGIPGTVQGCLDACKNGGFIFGGVEYGGECWCGAQTAATGAPATSGCNMPCSGNGANLCGGSNRLNMYKYGTTTTQPPTTTTQPPANPTGPVVVPSYAGWVSLGCWTDAIPQRTLNTGLGVLGTVPGCLDACKNAGFHFGGVEYGGECWCGAQTAAPGAPATSGCNMPCSGDGTTLCGGPFRLNMYNYTTPTTGSTTSSPTPSPTPPADPNALQPLTAGLPAPWHYAGCWVDNAFGRILANQGLAPSPTMTALTCINYCDSQGFVLAGLQFSQECWCGSSVNNAGTKATSDSQCNMPCGGDAAHACGGPNRDTLYSKVNDITVYPVPTTQTTNLFGSFQYAGCYGEPGAARVFPYFIQFPATNSPATCLARCSQYGYAAAGLEYGNECWCGDFEMIAQNNGFKAPETDCVAACPGDPTHVCGGVQRLSLYTWTTPPLYVWHQPANKGRYEFLIGGVVIPLISVVGINNKVVFLEKLGTGAPNSTGAYELDVSLANDFNRAWRTMHVESDVFCAANIVLPDKSGRILSIGGWSVQSTEGIRLYTPDGSPGVPSTNDWEENWSEVHLQQGRWYPTAMVMANGSILVVGGEDGSNGPPVPSLEILPTPAGGPTWLHMDWLERTDPNNLYPFLAPLPGGGIFVQYYNEARILDEVTFATTKELPILPGSVVGGGGRTYPLEGTTVILPQHAPYTDPIEFMSCGGSNFGIALDNCVSIQPEGAATWVIERMPSKRVMTLVAALPDGTFFISGGAHQGVAGFGLANDPNLNAILYDPSQPRNQRFSILGDTSIARLYHSEAVLLPDGRILVTGSDPEDQVHPQEYRVEVYVPPYLAAGLVQPLINALPVHDWTYGGSFQITIQLFQGGPVKFSLLGAVASTHGQSMGIRTIFPAFTCNGNQCTIVAPPNAHVCPPGWFQLFLLDGPTPSHSQWVRIGGDPGKLGLWPDFPDFAKPGL